MNDTSSGKSTFQMSIDPEIKQKVEAVFASYGLTLTEAVNIFFYQTLNEKGLPFLLSPENMEYKKSKAFRRLMEEVEKGWKSAEEDGWLTLDELEAQLIAANE